MKHELRNETVKSWRDEEFERFKRDVIDKSVLGEFPPKALEVVKMNFEAGFEYGFNRALKYCTEEIKKINGEQVEALKAVSVELKKQISTQKKIERKRGRKKK